MRVVVTGAAGYIGSWVCRALVEAGHDVLATDRRERNELPVELHLADLLDFDAVRPLLEGAQGVVHLGNYPGYRDPPGPRTFLDNVAMNHNVFEAARLAGTGTIVFASSIQVLAQQGNLHDGTWRTTLPYLPIDGEVPARPTNPYGLSKQAGEIMLAYYARRHGIAAAALRLPWTIAGRAMEYMLAGLRRPEAFMLDEVFSYLRVSDAASLVAAIVATRLEGFRVYQPAAGEPSIAMPVPEIVRTYYPLVELRRPIEEMDSLLDLSLIQRETGWRPTPAEGL